RFRHRSRARAARQASLLHDLGTDDTVAVVAGRLRFYLVLLVGAAPERLLGPLAWLTPRGARRAVPLPARSPPLARPTPWVCSRQAIEPALRGAAARAPSCYAPGTRYPTCSAVRRASIVSSTVKRTVVSSELSAPPPLIASATAAIDTLSGASQRLQPSCVPKAYQKPCSLPPTDSMYDCAAFRRSSGLLISLAQVSGV